MSPNDTIIGTVVRDAHNSFWLVLSPTKFIPVEIGTQQWLEANTPKAAIACPTCFAAMPTAV